MRYASAKDGWIKTVLFGAIALLAGAALIIVAGHRWLALIIIVPVVLFLLWVYYGTYYEFHKDYLLCKHGPFSERIRYDKIKSLNLTQNLFSSMALSSKRIEIRQSGKNYILGTTYISPENREEFLEELKRRCQECCGLMRQESVP